MRCRRMSQMLGKSKVQSNVGDCFIRSVRSENATITQEDFLILLTI